MYGKGKREFEADPWRSKHHSGHPGGRALRQINQTLPLEITLDETHLTGSCGLCKEETVKRLMAERTCQRWLRDKRLKQIDTLTPGLCMVCVQFMTKGTVLHHDSKNIIPMQSLCSIVHTYPEMSRQARPGGRHYRSSTVDPTREHQMQGEHPAGPWHFVESAKFSPPGNAGNQKLSVGINCASTFLMQAALCFQPIVRPALAERSEWLGVNDAQVLLSPCITTALL